jgi:hypothetical protein
MGLSQSSKPQRDGSAIPRRFKLPHLEDLVSKLSAERQRLKISPLIIGMLRRLAFLDQADFGSPQKFRWKTPFLIRLSFLDDFVKIEFRFRNINLDLHQRFVCLRSFHRGERFVGQPHATKSELPNRNGVHVLKSISYNRKGRFGCRSVVKAVSS